MIDTTEFHPIANIWPLLADDELHELVADIAANGLHYAIWRHRDGRIIDGRNRWLACQKAGVECPSNTYMGDDGAELVAFVVSLNEKRRHLSESQRAMVAARILEFLRQEGRLEREGRKRLSREIRQLGGQGGGDRRPCEICGGFQPISEAHHMVAVAALASRADSAEEAKPWLRLTWLCPNHHALVHEWQRSNHWRSDLWSLLGREEQDAFARIVTESAAATSDFVETADAD